MRQATSTVYTCGCADLTTKSGGAGVWWGEGDVRNIAVRTPGYSKNRAALLAVVKALECTLASYTRNPYTRCHLTIRTQTKYAIRAVTSRFKKFSEKDWQTDKGQRVNNADLIQYLHALLKYHEKHHGHATLMYIWRQSSELGRIRSSNLAIQGTRLDEEEAPDWMARQGRLERMQEDKAIWISLHYLFNLPPPVVTVKSEPVDAISVKKEVLDEGLIPGTTRVKTEPIDGLLPTCVKIEEL